MVALDPSHIYLMSPLILIILCGLVTHEIEGLSLRKAGGDTVIEYVYEVPLPTDQDFEDESPEVFKRVLQPSSVSYDLDLDKAIRYPERSSIYDSGDNYKPYQQEELIFSPGNMNELRVRPDGSAIFNQDPHRYDPEMGINPQRQKKNILDREITNNRVDEEEEDETGREHLERVIPLTMAEGTPESVVTRDDSHTETVSSQETKEQGPQETDEQGPQETDESGKSTNEMEEEEKEESEEDVETSDESNEESKQETVEVSDEEESDESSDSETEAPESSKEEESEVTTTVESVTNTEAETSASTPVVKDASASEVPQVENEIVEDTENGEGNAANEETNAPAEEAQVTLLEAAIKKFEEEEQRNVDTDNGATADYSGGYPKFDMVLRRDEPNTPYLEKRQEKLGSTSVEILSSYNQAPGIQEVRTDDDESDVDFPSWSVESESTSEEEDDDDGVDSDELEEEEQSTTLKTRNLQDSSSDDYYVDIPGARHQFYDGHPYPSYIGTPHRYKRSVMASGPIMSGPRAMLVNGQKVFVDTPQLSIDDEGVSVDRKTRQAIQEFVSVPTPKASRFPPQFCELDRDSGIICPGVKRGIFLDQFYYDEETNRCSHFVYNGCGGNANRFSTLWECTQFCGKHHDQKSKKK